MRVFETGATRDADVSKYDYEGFLSPFVLEAFGEYMHRNRKQADGNLRDSDNWQKGIPRKQYIKSLLRHTFAAWRAHRQGRFNLDDWMGILFNAQGYVLEQLISDGEVYIERPTQTNEKSGQQDHNRGSIPERSQETSGVQDGKMEARRNVQSDSVRLLSVPF